MPSPRLLHVATMLCAGLLLAASARAQEATELNEDFGTNPGALGMFIYEPPAPSDPQPLIVALHGCTMSAQSFDDETGLTALAREVSAVLLLPQQTAANNGNLCFNFFAAADNMPDRGESRSIRQAIAHIMETRTIDPDRVYVMGLSAGGGMTSVMVANYPDLFDGAAIFAGLPYGCNTASYWHSVPYWSRYWTFGEAAAALYACGIGVAGYAEAASPIGRDPDDWLALMRPPPMPGQDWPKLSIWQGRADTTVHPDNLWELTEQWTEVLGLDRDAGQQTPASFTDRPLTRTIYAKNGTPWIETWDIPGLAHDVPVDPMQACGHDTEGDHMADLQICAVREAARFFGLLGARPSEGQ